MSRQKNIPVKSYYRRAKVFGYLIIVIVVVLVALYIYERFIE